MILKHLLWVGYTFSLVLSFSFIPYTSYVGGFINCMHMNIQKILRHTRLLLYGLIWNLFLNQYNHASGVRPCSFVSSQQIQFDTVWYTLIHWCVLVQNALCWKWFGSPPFALFVIAFSWKCPHWDAPAKSKSVQGKKVWFSVFYDEICFIREI